MSWSIQVNGVEQFNIEDVATAKFEETYPEPAPGVAHQFESARRAAGDLSYAFAERDERIYNLTLSGHVKNNDSDSFVSIIVTQKDAVEDDPAED